MEDTQYFAGTYHIIPVSVERLGRYNIIGTPP